MISNKTLFINKGAARIIKEYMKGKMIISKSLYEIGRDVIQGTFTWFWEDLQFFFIYVPLDSPQETKTLIKFVTKWL